MIKLFVNLRYQIYRSINYFACENKNLTNLFKKKFKKKNLKVSTIYTRYFDKKLIFKKKNNQIFKKTKNTLIGSNNLCLNNMKILCKKYNIKSKIWFKNLDGDVKAISKKFSNCIKKININLFHSKNYILVNKH